MNQKRMEPYPENLWHEIYGQDAPPPADAEQVLTILMERAGLPDDQRAMLERHFRDGETLKAIAGEKGLTPERIRQLNVKSAALLRRANKRQPNGVTLKFGLAAHREIISGDAEVCFECQKVIHAGETAFLVRVADLHYSPAVELCCSRKCSEAAIRKETERLNEEYQKLLSRAHALKARMDAIQSQELRQEDIRELTNYMSKTKETVFSKGRQYEPHERD